MVTNVPMPATSLALSSSIGRNVKKLEGANEAVNIGHAFGNKTGASRLMRVSSAK